MTEEEIADRLKEIEQQVLSLKNDDDNVWALATLIYDRGSSDVVPFIKEHCSQYLYVKVLEGYVMGRHDT